jgi:hypothetical protein
LVVLDHFSRRAFIGASLAVAATLPETVSAIAAPSCVTGALPGFLPNRLTVDCASRMNFRLFRKNPGYLGLAGVVSMTFVRGKYGSYTAGNLFLFPWLTAKGRTQKVAWPSVAPTDATQFIQASPIPNRNLPLDEYFVGFVLEAPQSNFIGFSLEAPFNQGREKLPWITNVNKLVDGGPVGINWASSNLNRSWFGGSGSIPNSDTCNGAAWRKVIVDGLNQASLGVCAVSSAPVVRR